MNKITNMPNYDKVIKVYGTDLDRILSIRFEENFVQMKEIMTELMSKETKAVEVTIKEEI